MEERHETTRAALLQRLHFDNAMPERRFPPTWSVDELNDACFVVADDAGQKIAYVYFEDGPGRRSAAELVELISSYSDYRSSAL
jgi:hypothetical protein